VPYPQPIASLGLIDVAPLWRTLYDDHCYKTTERTVPTTATLCLALLWPSSASSPHVASLAILLSRAALNLPMVPGDALPGDTDGY